MSTRTYFPGRRGLLLGMVARAFSIRIMFFCLVVGVAAGVLVGLVVPAIPIMWVVWPVAAATYGLAVWGGGNGQGELVKCPQCRKRVKLGATACHHCGYTVA